MKISRSRLTEAFRDFVSRGSGIVIGEPGSGKTHTLRLFVEDCLKQRQVCVLLPVDRLLVETEADLKTELGYRSLRFVDFLASQKLSSDQKGILVIDALDAAKSDKALNTYLTLMAEVRNTLGDKWRIICSMRRYDAKKCTAVQDIFPVTEAQFGEHDWGVSDIACRHFFVPALADEDVYEAADTLPGLRAFYDGATEDVRGILRVPFNLWLVEKILASGVDLEALGQLQSQVELLDRYWQRRIEGNRYSEKIRLVLSKVARAMIVARALIVRRDDVYDPQMDEAWKETMQLNILEDVTATGQNVCFTHNILFDYVVSTLVIDETPDGLVQFLLQDPSRPLFLRPSIDYFLARLWRTDVALFWAVFWRLLCDDDPRLRLFARLLPTAAVIRGLRHESDLDPLLFHRTKNRKDGDDAILRLLQALKAQEHVNAILWAPILNAFSKDCSDSFIGELATSIAVMHKRAIKASAGDRDTIASLCGSAARNMLKWVWERRQHEGGNRFDGLGSFWLVPLVAKTFGYAPADSRAVLAPVWDLVKEKSFPIDYLSRLTDNISGIWKWDASFVAKTYETVFSYQEDSEATTSMGTPIMPISSNRRQDYRMCHYHLKNAFPGFLKEAPQIACETAVRCLTPYMVGSHVVPYLREGIDINGTIESFQFRGRTVRYIPDHSYIWAQSRYPEEPIEMADEVATYLRSVAAAGDTGAVQTVMDVLCDNVAGTYFWRQLFLVASENPGFFKPLMWDLALVPSFQVENDTVHELGLFLTAAAPTIRRSELKQIEASLLALAANIPTGADSELYRRRRNRLLNCIGLVHLQMPESREILAGVIQQNVVPENKPLARFESTWKPYTEEDHMKERGVDLSVPGNRELFNCFAPLGKFVSDWQNKKPSLEAICEIAPVLERAWNLLGEGGARDSTLLERLLTKCGECAETMARGIEAPDSQGFVLCREILLRCAADGSPEPSGDDEDHYRHASWSPAPRNEAAQGLPWLAARIKGDGDIVAAMERLSQDRVPSVRYLVASDLFRAAWNYTDDFWRIVEDRVSIETNRVVQGALCHSLSYAIQKDEKRACKVLDGLIHPAFKEGQESELLESVLHLVMGLYIVRDNQWAEGVSNRIVESPRLYRKALVRAMLDALSYITPAALSTPDGKAQAEKAEAWVLRGVDAAAVELSALLQLPKEEINEQVQEVVRSLYSSIDEVVMRLYFASGIFEGGKDSPAITDADRKRFYHFIQPMLDRVIAVCDHEKGGLMFASTAHYFMELLNGVLAYDVKHVLRLAHSVARVGTSGGYNLDSMAVREVVKLVETILANHRVDVRDGEALEDLLGILDIFSNVGWPDAMKLVWRLDEVFR